MTRVYRSLKLHFQRHIDPQELATLKRRSDSSVRSYDLRDMPSAGPLKFALLLCMFIHNMY